MGSDLDGILEVEDGHRKCLRVRIFLAIDKPLKRFFTIRLTKIKVKRLYFMSNIRGSQMSHIEIDYVVTFTTKEMGGKLNGIT